MFRINCLEITVTKNQWKSKKFQENHRDIYKNLLSDKDFESIEGDIPVNKRFLFNDFYKIENKCLKERDKRALSDDFWGKRINIQVVVGENGAGKSSLMELMYIAINNFSYLFERGNKEKRPGAAEMYYVPGLYVNLYFSFNNEIYILCCHDDKILLEHKGSTPPIFEAFIDDTERVLPAELKNLAEKRYNDADIKNIVKEFFYTIVSNYSMQSFVDANYKKILYHHINKENVDHDNYNEKYLNHDYNKEFDNNEPFIKSWISPIFHKNDGYIRSIVLNPYRHMGGINVSNEYDLSKDRFSSLLLYSEIKGNTSLFKPYRYSIIKASFGGNKFIEWSTNIFYRHSGGAKMQNRWDAFNLFRANLKKHDAFTKLVIEKFNLDQYDKEQELYWYSIMYIELKIIKIIEKYTAYLKYTDALKIIFKRNKYGIYIQNKALVNDLLTAILNDKSHITKKIRRTILFLQREKEFKYENNTFFITLNDFKKLESVSDFSPQLIDDFLPPSFLDWQVFFNKTDDHGNLIIDNQTNKPLEIPFNLLSSGEMLFIQTASTHAYHLMNLCSVPDNTDRPKYKYFNLVFDEVEISFHPELQRQFLKRLIDLLKDLNLPDDHYINIIIVTHSPFILSDIPASNILFLKNGTQDNSKKRISFAQNIGEMMYDSFFMTKTIGDFAEHKLSRLIQIYQGINPDTGRKIGKRINKELLDEKERTLKIIGDPIIRSLIEEIEENRGF